ncbi:hypothetical protein EJ08DRAFT_655646 [Tothia fuscella]|uniref:Uncharacterized protein n=1 Tax=Tothia fuscella TaxID=1048955 RepID=A0A9P4P4D9_9PEZI|nr:hypothetical protein EJ08DRAFT_655646 [Tothia fuscella]
MTLLAANCQHFRAPLQFRPSCLLDGDTYNIVVTRAFLQKATTPYTSTSTQPIAGRSGALKPLLSTSSNDSHEQVYAYEPFTTSLQQRHQRIYSSAPAGFIASRPSSSSGISSSSLRRTPGIENLHQARSRSVSATSSVPVHSPGQPLEPSRALPQVRFAEPEGPSTRQRSASQPASGSLPRTTHPALELSRRTKASILVALEAIRTPHPFTPDLVEENASMSEMYASGGRASNGGARADRGPVPVGGGSSSQPAGRPGVIPPTEIMRRRREKAAAEASAEELKRYPDQPQQTASSSRPSQMQQQQSQQQASQSSGQRRQPSGTARPISDPQHIPPYSSRPIQPDPSAGPGGGGLADASMLTSQQPQFEQGSSQQRPPRATQASGQPRPVGATAGPNAQRPSQPQRQDSGSRRPQQRGDSQQPGLPGATSGARTGGHSASASQGTTASSFPHAFERWETLSSHWEGLTSYWIHRLEQNNEELKNEPMLAQLSRQVTDLSAAGANLFHAVVELQRLRASSERKFQRWFFETRKEAERQQEITAQMEAALVSERQARANDAQRWETQIEQARRNEKSVTEMRRELQISKDEARRAWEELGRREQQERERTMALNQGQAIDVGGFIVYPKQFQGGQATSSSQRPGTRDGPLPQPPQEEYGYEPTASPSNTDPFTETRPLQHDATSLGVSHPYGSGGSYATSGSTTGTVIPAATSNPQSASSSFGRVPISQAAAGASSQLQQQQLHERYPSYQGTSSGAVSAPLPAGFYNQANTHLASGSTPPISTHTTEEGSYVPSQSEEYLSEQDEEWEMDERGQIVRDVHGNPIPYRRGLHRIRSGEESDEFDHTEDARREQELALQYGASSQPVSYPAVPAASSGRVQPTYQTATSSGSSSMRPPQQPPIPAPAVPSSRPPADYTGSGYTPPWEVTHHHPSRLSDVLEMDEEERQSRVSERSQGAQFGGNTGAPF